MLRQHGMSVPDTVRHGSPQVIFEQHSVLGYNYRMTDIQAAVGREQLKRLPEIVASRRVLASRYAELLTNNIGLATPLEPAYARSNWQSYCVRLPSHCDQRTVMQIMLDAGIATRRGIMCSHREAVYANAPQRMPLPHSEAAQDQCIILPLYPQMTSAEQEQVVTVLEEGLRPTMTDMLASTIDIARWRIYRPTSIEIRPSRGLFDLELDAVWRYRELLIVLTLRDIQVLYKQAALGVAWAIIQPLFAVIIFSVIFGHFARMPSDGIPYPVFAFAAVLPWTYFAEAMRRGGDRSRHRTPSSFARSISRASSFRLPA